jgi:cytochrome P450
VNGIRYFIPKSLLGLENCDQLWKQHRNIIIGAFTETYLKRYSEDILAVGKRLEENLIQTGGSVSNINELMANVAYEVRHRSPM